MPIYLPAKTKMQGLLKFILFSHPFHPPQSLIVAFGCNMPFNDAVYLKKKNS